MGRRLLLSQGLEDSNSLEPLYCGSAAAVLDLVAFVNREIKAKIESLATNQLFAEQDEPIGA